VRQQNQILLHCARKVQQFSSNDGCNIPLSEFFMAKVKILMDNLPFWQRGTYSSIALSRIRSDFSPKWISLALPKSLALQSVR